MIFIAESLIGDLRFNGVLRVLAARIFKGKRVTKTKVGVVGCGNISPSYFSINAKYGFFDIVACADLDVERAKMRAEEYEIPKACSVDELLADENVEVVLNLTVPQAHGPVAIQALQNGKSVYNEKPLAVARDDAQKMLQLAREKKLRVGGAPDTFLGGGIQTCRKLIDDGWIGEPVAASAFMLSRGVENWHPNPDFFFQQGGGPMFDMGPYYLTALVNLLGPVSRVSGSARASFATRTIRNSDSARNGEQIQVETPTHIAGVLDFQSGVVGTLVTSFDVYASPFPPITIFGSEGTLSVPDPNTFGGPVRVFTTKSSEWHDVPLLFGYNENSRGIGLADMTRAVQSGRAHRASGELAYHVLDLMHAFHDASNEGRHIELGSTCERPAPLPLGLHDGEIDS